MRHLGSTQDGAMSTFIGEQWLEPGQQVRRHTHSVQEVLTVLAGPGEAVVGVERLPIGTGVGLFIPPEVPHAFQCTNDRLHVLVIVPEPRFPDTSIVDD